MDAMVSRVQYSASNRNKRDYWPVIHLDAKSIQSTIRFVMTWRAVLYYSVASQASTVLQYCNAFGTHRTEPSRSQNILRRSCKEGCSGLATCLLSLSKNRIARGDDNTVQRPSLIGNGTISTRFQYQRRPRIGKFRLSLKYVLCQLKKSTQK